VTHAPELIAAVGLRPWRVDDAEALTAAARESTREVFPWGPWCHPEFSLAEARDWIEEKVVTWEQRSEFEFAVVDAGDRLMGACGINQIHTAYRFANLGYWVRTSATGRGVATAAVLRAAEFARLETDLVRLELVIAVANAASARVAERAGAQLEGVLRSRLVLHGETHDASMYALVLSR
jgi:RimJ/RimL family protein N-acetyltransferase